MNYSEIPFEVKLPLDANQVLTDENQLQLDQLDMEIQEIEMIDILFLDSPDLTLYQNGWIIRGRLKPNKDKWELTFKYRIELSQSEEPAIALEQALQAAASSGFDLSDPNCELEVEWSGVRNKKRLVCPTRLTPQSLLLTGVKRGEILLCNMRLSRSV